MPKLLNVGGQSKNIAIPPQYAVFEHILLDIDADRNPDLVYDARDLINFDANHFEAIYCSHNLEHYYRHDVRKVLAGFRHILKDGGFVHIRVPDIKEVMRVTLERDLDIDDVIYQSAKGPIKVVDVLYGHSTEIEYSGQDFFAHKTGFTEKSLLNALQQAGFTKVVTNAMNFEVTALAFKGNPSSITRSIFRVPDAWINDQT